MTRMLAIVGSVALGLLCNTSLGQFVPRIAPPVKVPVIPNLGGVGRVPTLTPPPTFPKPPRIEPILPPVHFPEVQQRATPAPVPARSVGVGQTHDNRPSPSFTSPVKPSDQGARTQNASHDIHYTGGGGEPPEGGDGDGDEGDEDDEEDEDEEDADDEEKASSWWPWIAGALAVVVVGAWFFR